jgi:hypothetical protein
MATRWREDNVHMQCRADNRFGEGDAAGYSLFMLKKYGEKHIEYLNALKNEGYHWTDFELELLIKEYKLKIKKLQSM